MLGEPAGSAPDGETEIGEWLAGLGLIRVTATDPAAFQMPGRFLARFPRGWAVMFGVPPGAIYDPAGVAAGETPLEVAVIAPLELPRRRNPAAAGTGRVEAIAITGDAEGVMRAVPEARAIAGAGLEGDRYAVGAGTFSGGGNAGRALTLIEAEAIAELAAAGVEIEPIDARRNLVVSGIELDALIGRRFRVGEVICRGARRCEPCAHLQRLTEPGTLRGLVHRGGLRADLLSGGTIRRGDEVEALD
jgi:MOSC domain-containing protein YiiM